jgi:hypothetical protein
MMEKMKLRPKMAKENSVWNIDIILTIIVKCIRVTATFHVHLNR